LLPIIILLTINSPMTTIQKIPTNVITGFLGVGKTTAILHLLKTKPADERWLVVVNEFGEVPIDQVLLEDPERSDLNIRYVAGGCICCTANLPMQMTLTLALRQVKPHRVLIEPTGIGHPAEVLEMLQNKHFGEVLDVRATVCLINPQHLDSQKHREHETWQDQVSLADVLIANKIDTATEAQMAQFETWAHELYPPKQLIAMVEQGRVEVSWLDGPVAASGGAVRHAHTHGHGAPATATDLPVPLVGQPLVRPSEGFGRYGCGWVFSPDEVFEWSKLTAFFTGLTSIQRAKGVFRVEYNERVLFNYADGQLRTDYIAYRRDSRVELISDYPQNWQAVGAELLNCLAIPTLQS
jgi:G3E family GTPase